MFRRAAFRAASTIVDKSRLTVRKAVADSDAGSAAIYQWNNTLQFVMAGAVKEVAESDHARGFPRKIKRESRSAAGEQARYRIQFPSTILQVGIGNSEVESARCRDGGKQETIFLVPEAVARCNGQRLRLRNRSAHKGLKTICADQFQRRLLAKCRGRENREQKR